MKLSEFTQDLDREILKEEFELELPVMRAEVLVALKQDGKIIIHKWEYEKKGDLK